MTGTRSMAALAAVLLGVALAGCGEKPQTAGGRKADAKAYEPAASSAFVARGWKAGDKLSWEEEQRSRAQNQNEYSRAPAAGQ